MNHAGVGHVELATRFSSTLGLGAPRRRLDTARALLSAGTPFSYLTLTNDHQHQTEAEHDVTLRWDRSLAAETVPGVVRFIGPPGKYVDEMRRKKDFCRWSEQLEGLFKQTPA